MLPSLARSVFRSPALRAAAAGTTNLLSRLPSHARRSMFIQTQPTPNAHALMFLPGRHVMPNGAGTADFPSAQAASRSALARRLFEVSGVRAVFFGGDFVTVTKDVPVEWGALRPDIFEVLMEFFTAGDHPVMAEEAHGDVNVDTAIADDDDEVVAMIKELLETRVKPAVAEDGGSIVYRGFDAETGVVRLEMQGACSTCSSSSITLKNGVENMLRHYIQEVATVEQVGSQVVDEVLRENERAFSDVEKRLGESGILRP